MTTGHVSLWHPWNDRTGRNHTVGLWQDQQIVTSTKVFKPQGIEDFIEIVGRNRLYVLCRDVLDSQDIPENEGLLRHKKTEPYASRTGNVVALRMKSKYNGYFIPSRVWASRDVKPEPTKELGGILDDIYRVTGFEAITPASLSEKILRSTLPEKLAISRPSDMLRRFLLENSIGGRIDQAEGIEFYPNLWQYDLSKAYLSFAQRVPTPFEAPMRLYYGDKPVDFSFFDYPLCFVECTFSVHDTESGIHPVQINENGVMRKPRENDIFTRGMFTFEIDDCLNAGYTLESVSHGYAWNDYSSFLSQWSDILINLLDRYKGENFAYLFKQMMVALPGRFLRSPETFRLMHEEDHEMQAGDIGICYSQMRSERVQSPWFLRPEYELQSAQLTTIGMYIIARCRQALYHDQLEEWEHGNTLIASYIDSNTYRNRSTRGDDVLGFKPGQWKEKEIGAAIVSGNMIIPENIEDMRAPSYSGENARKELYKRMRQHIKGKERTA